ncbi:hypothetical protein [Enhydrobacter aerosaccus]|uniref:hypothetical protein n=1 Tax=Enhydrobacter aerosaccus TaxID=225324 RepID=UPI001116DB74|nr:hypothetical protein [Enhydrobacter aerosaccus]
MAAIVVLIGGGAIAYWQFADQPPPWFVGTPIYTARTDITGNRLLVIHSKLLYSADGKYSATRTVYEHGKPPAEQSYAGSWRQDGQWICLRMDWKPDREFCNTFIETEQGWIVLNKGDARTTPVMLAAPSPPSEQDLVPLPPGASCSFAGSTVAHATSVMAFEASVVNPGQSCKAEVRTCTDGELSGSFPYAVCSAAIVLPLPSKKPAPRRSPPRP